MRYTVTNDSVTVILDGVPRVVRASSLNYSLLKRALLEEDWEAAKCYLSAESSLRTWSRGNFALSEDGRKLLYWGRELPAKFSSRVVSMLNKNEDVSPLLAFHERLANNPSKNSVEQLFSFLTNLHIPVEPKGTFLVYKSVRTDYKDFHTGTVDYTPPKFGEPQKFVTLPRKDISDDPAKPCHYGLHVGALPYVRMFGGEGGKVLICRIDPKDVVCVPNDHDFQKMRVCRLEVLGEWSGTNMPSTSVDLNKMPGLLLA